MKARTHRVQLDRIVLEGFDLPPERAEQIRALVETELTWNLDKEGTLQRMCNAHVATVAPPALDLDLSVLSDQEIVDILVEHINQTLRRMESAEQAEPGHV